MIVIEILEFDIKQSKRSRAFVSNINEGKCFAILCTMTCFHLLKTEKKLLKKIGALCLNITKLYQHSPR